MPVVKKDIWRRCAQLKGGGKHKQFGKWVKRDKNQSAHHISESPVHLSSEEEVFTLHNLTEPKIAKYRPYYH